MTALDRYVRLESDALWRADPDAQRRDVVISFGDATLVIADQAGRPLSHWSLTALRRTNPGERPAVYAPDGDTSELLEIADPTMVDAIEEVRRALARAQPRPGKLRLWLTLATLCLVGSLAVLWLPKALVGQALAIVPAAKQKEIGTAMLRHMAPTTGGVCRTDRADAASARLAARLFGSGTDHQIVVVPSLDAGVTVLPGQLIVIGEDILRDVDDPAAAAGFILSADVTAQVEPPLEVLLSQSGLPMTLRLLTTGAVDDAQLQAHALRLAQTGATPAEPPALAAALAAADIPFAPYRTAIDARTGNTPDLGHDPSDGQSRDVIMGDTDWVSLRNVCANAD